MRGMYYPLCLSLENIEIHPLFGRRLTGSPHIFDFSSKNDAVSDYDTADFDKFQKLIFQELEQSEKRWGIGRYLEERQLMLSRYPQMQEEQRFYHVGLDIVLPEATPVYAPLDGTVHDLGIDEGLGNYGGYLILRHTIAETTFYSFYGHLNSLHLVNRNQEITAGEVIGRLGARTDSGGWFTHVHLQIITQYAMDQGRHLQGYVTLQDLARIDELFPSPYPLVKTHW